MNFTQLIQEPAPWMASTDDGHDVVLTSRVRLARNLRDIPFPGWATTEQRTTTYKKLREATRSLPSLRNSFSSELCELDQREKQLLVERHLISRELAARSEGCGVAISKNQSLSILFNEEDHLRLQFILPGLQLKRAWFSLNKIDSTLEARLPYAYDNRLGYLTSCPTNLGTGMRASAMLHLPGLVLDGAMEQVFRAAEQLHLTIRGLYGEGTAPMGNLFQLSNQSTLGEGEELILDRLKRIIQSIFKQECNARQRLFKGDPLVITDKICKAYGIMKFSTLLSSQEAFEQISMLRMGATLGLIDKGALPKLNTLILNIQPAHLHSGPTKSLLDKDHIRAAAIRQFMEDIPEPNINNPSSH